MACRLKMKGLGLWQAATMAGKHTFKWTPNKVQIDEKSFANTEN